MSTQRERSGMSGTEGEHGLFVTDRELHRLISPRLGWDRFREKLRLAELRGFPPLDSFWGGRYWPKVRAWLDKDNRLDDHDTIPLAQDGPENFDAKPRPLPRSKTKQVGKAVLDSAAGDAQPARLSRHLHSVARES
jgi:hypothetical protein